MDTILKTSLTDFLKALISRRRGEIKEISKVVLFQVYFTFIQALPYIIPLALAAGVAIMVQGASSLSKFGAVEKLGQIWVMIILREIAPLIAGILVLARSGTAVAAELASMKVHKEIEALEMMGIPPLEYIVAPRIMAGGISTFCMGVCTLIFAFIGSAISANLLLNFGMEEFLRQVVQNILFDDLIFFILKTSIMGLGIFVNSCRHGFGLQLATFEIPIITIKAVVGGLVWMFCVQVFFSGLFYIINGFHL